MDKKRVAITLKNTGLKVLKASAIVGASAAIVAVVGSRMEDSISKKSREESAKKLLNNNK